MKTMIISIIAVLASVAVSGQSLTLTVKDVEHVMWRELFMWLSIRPKRTL